MTDHRSAEPRSWDRRQALLGLATGIAALPALGGEALAGAPPPEPCGPASDLLPNVVLVDHEGRKGRFVSDWLRDRTVLVHFTSVAREGRSPAAAVVPAAALAEVQRLLGSRLGREMAILTLTSEPATDGPHKLAALASRYGAGPGWHFLSGEPAAIEEVQARLFASSDGHRHGEDCSQGLARYGNAKLGLWGSVPLVTAPAWIAERLLWVSGAGRAVAGADAPPRRRGPLPLATLLLAGLLGLLPGTARAQHPHPQPMPEKGKQWTEDGTLFVSTSPSLFPPSHPFTDPVLTNLLPKIYTNLYDCKGNEILNTLPSTPTVPYNLIDGSPVVTPTNPLSPTDDLQRLFSEVPERSRMRERNEKDVAGIRRSLQLGIDILEGNPIPDRAYSGLPLLHYLGPLKQKKVTPIVGSAGTTVGGNVDVHQVWYDGHIESDTYLLDAGAAYDVPWTITYTVDVLNRGEDDFSPFTMYFDLPGADCPEYRNEEKPDPRDPQPVGTVPLAGMDQTFFPMQDGTRTVFRIKMPPAKYWNLTYTWGWRMHPPRIQVIENARKKVGAMTTVEWETSVFGANPLASPETKRQAIDQIGELAPEKRMWRALCEARTAAEEGRWDDVATATERGREAFFDWQDRNRLPSGVAIDESADLTLLYVNNTIYGQFTAGTLTDFPPFQTRGSVFKVTLLNGDNFQHAYQNVDFGGARGWENQFKSSVKVGGSGCWFTFGRVYWLMNLAPMATIPAATSPEKPGVQKVQITYEYDPSRRLRFYQFDPTHHDVAIYSIH